MLRSAVTPTYAVCTDGYAMHVESPPGTTERWIDAASFPPLPDHALTWIGVSDTGAGYLYRNRCQPGWLVAAVEGRAEAWQDGGWRPLPNRALYVAPPAADIGVRALGPARIFWSCGARTLSTSAVTGPERVAAPELRAMLVPAIDHACDELGRADATASLAHWLALVTSLSLRAIARAEGAEPHPPPLEALWRSVLARPAEAWTLDRLCRRSGLPRERLRRLCHEAHACSPVHHVTALRLRHAAMLLTRTAAPIAEIARRVGYRQPFAFTAAFRRAFGESPRHYRDRVAASG